MPPDLSHLEIHYSDEQQLIMQLIMAMITFGIALDLHPKDFVYVLKRPWGVFAGMFGQFVWLPAMTSLFILLVPMSPYVALGMLLLACCPGGGVSNFITSLARGNVALSVSMTAMSSSAAAVLTPINFAFWASINPQMNELLTRFELDPIKFMLTLLLYLGVPLVCGIWLNQRLPKVALLIRRPLRILSGVCMVAFIVVGVGRNIVDFIDYLHLVFWVTIVHNAIALASGYGLGKLVRAGRHDCKAISLEVGMQNAAIGLAIIFGFFNGQPLMALIVAWWGIWHLISGLSLAYWFSRLNDPEAQLPTASRKQLPD